ncbi:hypothetical protein M409DRAFT_22915 [Zasmidium cellare ATCC 36951]|uniref:Uncharacterized protein n=1 Tax=Zasmidium cellare ATCC 36951 TaxID=1080233 RepID=A0A6A6CLP4_ZASCE|nr:uncharacterized protein M409DRAFT_22915 [Zasmidium cellare ATCC 36951]KAF2166862.1 hypothetical protein M409DRAFT_22915 [Zasmidium cellare ATCC 36951]
MSNNNDDDDDVAFANLRRKMADQLARDKAEWFGEDWEVQQEEENDNSNQFCSDQEMQAVFKEMRKGSMLDGHTYTPGAGYTGDYTPAQQARFRGQLARVRINWHKNSSTRRRLDIGPKNELAPEFEGLTASEVAARFPGESVEMGGEFDGDQTIVVARAQTPQASTEQDEEEDAGSEDVVDEDGDVGMEDASSSVEDDAEDDPDYENVSPRSKKRARK